MQRGGKLMGRRRQAVTIRQVAADAGVSLQTVSRLIHNAPNVRPEMQEHVSASIDSLGYVPSIADTDRGDGRDRVLKYGEIAVDAEPVTKKQINTDNIT